MQQILFHHDRVARSFVRSFIHSLIHSLTLVSGRGERVVHQQLGFVRVDLVGAAHVSVGGERRLRRCRQCVFPARAAGRQDRLVRQRVHVQSVVTTTDACNLCTCCVPSRQRSFQHTRETSHTD